MCKYERDVGLRGPSQLRSTCGMLSLQFGLCGSCCLGRRQQGARQLCRLVQVGYMLVSGTEVCCCRSPGEGKVMRWTPRSVGMWGSSCLAWWLRGYLRGLAAGRNPPLPSVSSGLTCLASHMGIFPGKLLRSLQAGSLTGARGSASRRQPAKPCRESACPINI